MEFKQYPSYKNSGVEWLGDVPDEWDIYPFWHLFNRKEITNKTQEQLLSVYLDRGVILHSEGGGMVHKPADNLEKYQLVEVNDFVMNNQQAWRGSVGVSPYKGIVSPAYLIFSFNKKICAPKFFKYFLRDKGVVDQFMIASMSVGTIQRQVKWHLLKTIQLSIPSLIEQNTIANFLDTETARIDNLISKQEKLIELLEEQRKSIISHAVTKGLNPNAPMKDSGVEWLGDVPEHWEVTFIKYITKKISSGKTPLGGAEVYTDEGVIFLRSQNIYNDGLHLDDVSFIPHEIHASMKSSAVKKNDVLLNITGGSIGRTCLVDCEIGEANVNQHVCIIRTSKDKYAKWLSVFMKSNSAQSQIFYSQTGAGREGLNFSQIGNMRLLFPPFVEQQEILDFLDQENLRFDNLILKQQSLIEKMKEYRASIISHAVTGKIDVREFGT